MLHIVKRTYNKMNQSTLDKIKKQNLHLLRVIENYSEEKKQEIWACLIANYK